MGAQYFWNRGAIALLLLAYFVLRCHYLDTVPRWDAASYWGALMSSVNATLQMSSWTQLPKIILDTYNAFGHPSMGYYSLLVLGQLHDFPNLFMLNMTNIVLAMLSIFSVYKIFRWFLPEAHSLPEVLLATAAYAMEPLFFGCSIYLNTDFPVLVFFTVSLACLLYGNYGGFALASIFMVFSKEPGIIFWGSMVGGLGLYSLWVLYRGWKTGVRPTLGQLLPPFYKNKQQPITKLASVIYCGVCLLLPGIAFKLFTIAQKGAMWVGGSGFKFDSNGMNCFGFNPRVIANRAGEIFVLNFHWVLVAISLIALSIGIGRYIERKRLGLTRACGNGVMGTDRVDVADQQSLCLRWWGLLPIVFSFLTFVAFNLSYITYIIPRYVMASGFFLLLFTLLALQYATHTRPKRLLILAVILALFVVQTFRTIDPLSKLAFGTAPFSQHEILQIDSPGEAVGNGFVYNAEFTAVDKLFNLMQKAVPLKPDTQIIAWNSDNWYPWFYMGGVFVDSETLKRTVDWRNSFHYNVIDVSSIYNVSLPADAIYLYMPWLSVFSNEQAELNQLRAFYQISAPEEVGFQGYSLRFYRLQRLPH